MNIKRYDLVCSEYFGAGIGAKDNGKYVKHEDHLAAISVRDQHIEHEKKNVSTLQGRETGLNLTIKELHAAYTEIETKLMQAQDNLKKAHIMYESVNEERLSLAAENHQCKTVMMYAAIHNPVCDITCEEIYRNFKSTEIVLSEIENKRLLDFISHCDEVSKISGNKFKEARAEFFADMKAQAKAFLHDEVAKGK